MAVVNTGLPADTTTEPVEQIDVHEAARRLARGALLIDVREAAEQAAGMPAGAEALPRAQWSQQLPALAGSAEEILLICAAGQRSLRAAGELRALGQRRVASVRGGCAAWQAAGLPLQAADGGAAPSARYARQLILPEVGVAGQARLAAARVLLVGAGGLGCPAALYLAAAGVGRLTLVDGDRVELSNLHRQVLHVDAAIGSSKVHSAAERLRALNPEVEIEAIAERLGPPHAAELVAAHDVVVDGSDNFATRYLLNAECVAQGKPLVYAAVHRFEAQVSLFLPGQGPCYRCLFPQPPPPEAAPNCAEAGVLGVVPGIAGLLQANECLKLILGHGQTLAGRLLCFDARSTRWRELALPRDPDCPGCGPRRRPVVTPTETCAWEMA